MSELTRKERLQVLQRLEEMADEIGQISTWLTKKDEDKAAIRLECMHRDAESASWVLSPPLRYAPEGWLSRPDGPRTAP